MSSKTRSPTAQLLRNSRLFSLPMPLPRPSNDFLGHAQSNIQSDSATLPHPIRQAIATPPSSLYRGDWGLKRPLPLRSTTKTSTPVFRVNAIDTLEHITDFESAADLTLTLQKFLELNLPIVTNPERIVRSTSSAPRSVFDPELDNTDRSVAGPGRGSKERWKYRGPWVSGMTQRDFNDYVLKELSKRKSEFREYVREYLARQMLLAQKREVRNEGRDPSAEIEVSEEDLSKYIDTMRSDFTTNSQLGELVHAFLDLPGTIKKGHSSFAESHIQKGPPKTHPSAGLSYIRSSSFLTNHPILGPQARHAPVEARILADRTVLNSQVKDSGKLGVAGIVAKDMSSGIGGRLQSTPKSASNDTDRAAARKATSGIGLTTPGGNRIWVEPERAHVDSQGRINMFVLGADMTAVGVHTGDFNAPNQPAVAKRESIRPLIDVVDIPGGTGLGGSLDNPSYRRNRGSSKYGINEKTSAQDTDPMSRLVSSLGATSGGTLQGPNR